MHGAILSIFTILLLLIIQCHAWELMNSTAQITSIPASMHAYKASESCFMVDYLIIISV